MELGVSKAFRTWIPSACPACISQPAYYSLSNFAKSSSLFCISTDLLMTILLIKAIKMMSHDPVLVTRFVQGTLPLTFFSYCPIVSSKLVIRSTTIYQAAASHFLRFSLSSTPVSDFSLQITKTGSTQLMEIQRTPWAHIGHTLGTQCSWSCKKMWTCIWAEITYIMLDKDDIQVRLGGLSIWSFNHPIQMIF